MYEDERAKQMAVLGQGVGLQSIGVGPQSMTERFHRQRDELKGRLELLNEAIEALESNPEVAKAVDAISKVGGLY